MGTMDERDLVLKKPVDVRLGWSARLKGLLRRVVALGSGSAD